MCCPDQFTCPCPMERMRRLHFSCLTKIPGKLNNEGRMKDVETVSTSLGGLTLDQNYRTLSELKEAEREARKQMILSATLKLFGEKKISEVSMRDIAKEAGISPALIYRHFDDKDELFIESFLLKISEMFAQFEETFSGRKQMSIEEIGEAFIQYLLNNPLFFKMMSYFMLDYTLVEDHLEKFNNAIREFLAIFDEGFRQNGLEENVRIYSHAFFSALNGIMITFYHYPGRSEEEIKEHILRLTKVISGLFTKVIDDMKT